MSERLKSVVMLAKDADKMGGIEKILSKYGGSAWMSVKFDGMRALWNGKALTSRYGKPIYAPSWWLGELEYFRTSMGLGILDGELWMGNGAMQSVMSVCRRHSHKGIGFLKEDIREQGIRSTDSEWNAVRYCCFDASDINRGWLFTKEIVPRLAKWNKWSKSSVLVVQQDLVSERSAVEERMEEVTNGGGEGVMLRSPSLIWAPTRTSNLVKVKPEYDSEAVVVGWNPGLGKYTGMIGSLRVRDKSSGLEFDLSSGLSDSDRGLSVGHGFIGREVSYRYAGLTEAGLPRHAALTTSR